MKMKSQRHVKRKLPKLQQKGKENFGYFLFCNKKFLFLILFWFFVDVVKENGENC